jgi:hypothetical protein
VRTIATGQTGWFSSPGLVDLDGEGTLEIVAPDYSTFIYGAAGARLGVGTASKGRVYAPAVVADLDGDHSVDIVAGGNDGTVAAYEFRTRQLQIKPGWPASTCSGGQCPETRAMAAGDLDHDGRIEIVVATTNTSGTGAQVFVFTPDGTLYRPAGAAATSWPRYNALSGAGGDAAFNGSCPIPACRTNAVTATVSGSPPPPPSATSTATAPWRSSPPASTTASTCSPCQAPTPRVCHGRPVAVASCGLARPDDRGPGGGRPGRVGGLRRPPAAVGRRPRPADGDRHRGLIRCGGGDPGRSPASWW